ncbi:DUF6446 family protein [Salibaculum griseiflavum]|uniref:Histidine kinase n=1 Tax=Salibaculum griseiflavum TaxID=1914409 RepID=A0A2V1P3W8_9RHOB|nr:DUF6446 family protein [Salibaculum griseiflavum]PWG17211.1 histidine kinase [Salibaculum griseiflavum]
MNAARFAVLGIVLTAIVAGVSLYYLQVYAYYDEVSAEEAGEVQLTSVVSGQPEIIPYENFEGIDSNSSPIRFRACFETPLSQALLTETYVISDDAVPLNGPDWFACYDAQEIGAALESGEAIGFVGVENIEYGIDRVVAIMTDGRGFVWHQINRCGEVVFDGEPVPDDCPEPPEAN